MTCDLWTLTTAWYRNKVVLEPRVSPDLAINKISHFAIINDLCNVWLMSSSWHQNLIRSSPQCANMYQLCRWSSSCLSYRENESVTSGWMDRRPGNIMPLVTLCGDLKSPQKWNHWKLSFIYRFAPIKFS